VKFRLLQARLPGDPVRLEERQAFAARLGVRASALTVHDLLEDPLHPDAVLDGVDAVLVGGSGAVSITQDLPWLHTRRYAWRAVRCGPRSSTRS